MAGGQIPRSGSGTDVYIFPTDVPSTAPNAEDGIARGIPEPPRCDLTEGPKSEAYRSTESLLMRVSGALFLLSRVRKNRRRWQLTATRLAMEHFWVATEVLAEIETFDAERVPASLRARFWTLIEVVCDIAAIAEKRLSPTLVAFIRRATPLLLSLSVPPGSGSGRPSPRGCQFEGT